MLQNILEEKNYQLARGRKISLGATLALLAHHCNGHDECGDSNPKVSVAMNPPVLSPSQEDRRYPPAWIHMFSSAVVFAVPCKNEDILSLLQTSEVTRYYLYRQYLLSRQHYGVGALYAVVYSM